MYLYIKNYLLILHNREMKIYALCYKNINKFWKEKYKILGV